MRRQLHELKTVAPSPDLSFFSLVLCALPICTPVFQCTTKLSLVRDLLHILEPISYCTNLDQLQIEDNAFRYSPSSLPFILSQASFLGSDSEVTTIPVILSISNPPGKFPSSSIQQITILKIHNLQFKHTSTDPSLAPHKLYSENIENIFVYQLLATLG